MASTSGEKLSDASHPSSSDAAPSQADQASSAPTHTHNNSLATAPVGLQGAEDGIRRQVKARFKKRDWAMGRGLVEEELLLKQFKKVSLLLVVDSGSVMALVTPLDLI